mgnify:CR=1 FL=1|tara:strand:+ start:418 stop:747 length:330 start_codon:yes stop_codon:yes gene_type:complete
MLYIVDTETNGLPSKFGAAYQDVEAWPRMQSIAFKLENHDAPGETEEIIVRADFKICEKASSIHGITAEISRERGVPIQDVLARFASVVGSDPSPTICAYNADFDKGVM